MADSDISPLTRRLWSIVYHCILVFGCPVIFKETPSDVSRRQGQHVDFFVPDPSRFDPVVDFLDQELRPNIRHNRDDPQLGFLPGFSYRLSRYNGILPFVPHEVIEKVADELIEMLREAALRDKKGDGGGEH